MEVMAQVEEIGEKGREEERNERYGRINGQKEIPRRR